MKRLLLGFVLFSSGVMAQPRVEPKGSPDKKVESGTYGKSPFSRVPIYENNPLYRKLFEVPKEDLILKLEKLEAEKIQLLNEKDAFKKKFEKCQQDKADLKGVNIEEIKLEEEKSAPSHSPETKEEPTPRDPDEILPGKPKKPQ